MANELAWLDKASAAIARVESIGEAKDIADKASALKLIAAKQQWSRSEKARLGEIEVRATVRLGELLADAPKSKGGRTPKTGSREEPVLSDIGLNKKQSHVAQRLASVPKRERDAYIREAVEAGEAPTVTGLARIAKKKAKAAKRQEAAPTSHADTTSDLESLAGKFGTIYADPPWQYGNQSTRAATDNHYGTMSMEELYALPVERLAADDAHCHLWVTSGFLQEGLNLLTAWGFEYRSQFVWVKPQMGIGNYWRLSHELMLLGIRGDAKRFNDRSLMSWMEANRTRHSAKPEQVRAMIERASPGPYLELFGRTAQEGWTVWGNEVERTLWTQTA